MPGPKPAFPAGEFAHARPSQWQAFDPSGNSGIVRKVVPEMPSNQSNEAEPIEPIRPGEDAG